MKFKIAVLLGVLVIFSASYAETIYGPCNFSNRAFDDLTCMGPANLNNVTVKDELKVMGLLNAKKSDFNDLDVKGVANITKTTITGNVTVYGPLDMSETIVKDDVVAATTVVNLSRVTLMGNLTVQSDMQQPVVNISKSQITKNLVFSKKAGLVNISTDSKISGKIKNGSKQVAKKK